jgi:hypothetical protein
VKGIGKTLFCIDGIALPQIKMNEAFQAQDVKTWMKAKPVRFFGEVQAKAALFICIYIYAVPCTAFSGFCHCYSSMRRKKN